MNINKKQIISVLVLILSITVLILIANYAYNYFTKAKVEIKSNYSSIKLENSEGVVVAEGYGQLKKQVKPGVYVFSINNNVERAYERLINLESKKNYSFQVDLEEVASSEILMKADPAGYYATDTNFFTLNRNGEAITIGNELLRINKTNQFIRQARVYGLSEGYMINLANELSKLNDQAIQKISLPNDVNKLSYQISANKLGDLLIFDTNLVYLYKDSRFNLLYKTDQAGSRIISASLSSNSVFINEESVSGNEKISRISKLGLNGSLAKQIEFRGQVDDEIREDNQDEINVDNIDLYASPSGERLALKNNKKLFIYDSNLESYQTVGVSFVQNLFWANDNDLFFSEGDKIYRHNYDENSSQVITISPSAKSISSLFVVDQKVYYSSFNSQNDPIIYKAEIGKTEEQKNPEADLVISNLSSDSNQCKFLFANYSKNTIYVNNTSDPCYNIVNSLIKKYSLNKNNIDIKNYAW